MGSFAGQWLECLACRQGSGRGRCVNFAGDLKGRLWSWGCVGQGLGVLSPASRKGGACDLTRVLPAHTRKARRTTERSQRGTKLHPRCLGHHGSFSFYVNPCTTPEASPFPSAISKAFKKALEAFTHPVQ